MKKTNLTESDVNQIHEWLNEFYTGNITKQQFLTKIDEAKLNRDQVKEVAWAPVTALIGGGIGAAAVAADKGLNPLKWSKDDWTSIGVDAALGATGAGLAGVAGRHLAKKGIKKGIQYAGKKLAKKQAKAALTNKQIGGKIAKAGVATGASSPAIDSAINIASKAAQ